MQSMGDVAAFSAQLRVAGDRSEQDRQRSAPHGHGPAHRHRRDHAAGRAARLVDHAGQDQSVDSRDGESGLLPGHGLRHDGVDRGRARPARAQRHDAGDRVQRAAVDADPHQRGERLRRQVREGHRGQSRDVRVLGRALGGAGDGARAADRLREGGGDQQAVGEGRRPDSRHGEARQDPARRRGRCRAGPQEDDRDRRAGRQVRRVAREDDAYRKLTRRG